MTVEIKTRYKGGQYEDPENSSIGLGDLTIKISGMEYDAFAIIRSEYLLSSEDTLQEIILEGLHQIFKKIMQDGKQ